MSTVTAQAKKNSQPIDGRSFLEMMAARPQPKLNKARYRKVSAFFFKLALHVVWWDVILDRPALQRFRKPPIPRWKEMARQFRDFAVETGGVMIKLGQFLSVRVDLLPAEVTRELKTLRDAVPAAPTSEVIRQIEEDFGCPIGEIFPSFSAEPLGAASLAQAHAATLPNGQPVVVKVLRPGIADIVETDLTVIGVFLKRLSWVESFRKQVDTAWLHRELSNVTRKELDTHAEGKNCERFGKNFADEPSIYVPKIYWEYTKRRTLTMEDVGFIPLDDTAAMEAAGINLEEVGNKLFDCYLAQVLVHDFVHVDPHGGNLFIRPMRAPGEMGAPFAPGDTAPYMANRPFQIAFVDFGMAVQIPKRVRAALRNYVVGIVSQDTQMIIQSYIDAGMLAPDADLRVVEDMTNTMLERFAGTFLGQMQDINVDDYVTFLADYQELIHDAPFILQIDLLFVFRAIGMLSGVVFTLNPHIDPMERAKPFASKLAESQFRFSKEGILKTVQDLIRLPGTLLDVLGRVPRYGATTELSPASLRQVAKVDKSLKRLTWVMAGMSLFVCGIVLESTGVSLRMAMSNSGFVLCGLGALTAIAGCIKER